MVGKTSLAPRYFAWVVASVWLISTSNNQRPTPNIQVGEFRNDLVSESYTGDYGR